MTSTCRIQSTILGGLAIATSFGIVCLYRENGRLKRKLREILKSTGGAARTATPTRECMSESSHSDFTMHEIGVVHSPFPQRAGCPRQGTLAPHVVSHIVLNSNMTSDIVDGITAYSHVWIVFSFHLNARGKAKSGARGAVTFTAAKVRPPRAGGLKVGVLATRAPHRPNPVGLSLAILDSVTTIKLRGRSRVCLVLRGLDLVDNTPVYDIKPYVTWDSVSHSTLHVPTWVSTDDQLAQVVWNDMAQLNLTSARHHLSPFYPCTDQGMKEAFSAIAEIVSQDPRALQDGRGKSSQSTFDFSFGELRVSFVVEKGKVARIGNVMVDQGDITATMGSYPHNLAVRRNAEMNAMELGEDIPIWAGPVREGETEGVLKLQNGRIREIRP